MLASNEELSADFLEWGGKDVPVIRCKHSGNVYALIRRDKSNRSACEVIHRYIHTFGLPHRMITDWGRTFRSNFEEYLKGYVIEHRYTSAYRASLNGLNKQWVVQ